MKPNIFAVAAKVKEGLLIISKYEKLSKNEGRISITYARDIADPPVGLTVYAPHLIPGAVSYYWEEATWEDTITTALKDLTNWVEAEKDAPRDKFSLDF